MHDVDHPADRFRGALPDADGTVWSSKPLLVLLVDDNEEVLLSLERVLMDRGFTVAIAQTGAAALAKLAEGLRPDMAFVDHHLEGLGGLDVLEHVRRRHPNVVRVGMGGCSSAVDVVNAINTGVASCYLLKPWVDADFEEVLAAATRLVYTLRVEGLKHAEQVDARDNELAVLKLTGLQALASCIEARDPYTAGHGALVGAFAAALGEAVGFFPEDLECLRLGGQLHDIGKIGLPDAVLFKPGRLSAEELAVVRCHPEMGVRILERLHLPFNVLPIVRSHHERWDGGGYPNHTAGTATHEFARIVHVVDVFEALTSKRIYRDPMPPQQVVEFFINGRGTDFDPSLVEPFLALLSSGVFDNIRQELKQTVAQRQFAGFERGMHPAEEVSPAVEAERSAYSG